MPVKKSSYTDYILGDKPCQPLQLMLAKQNCRVDTAQIGFSIMGVQACDSSTHTQSRAKGGSHL